MSPRELLDRVSIIAVWRELGGAEPIHGRVPGFWRNTRDRNVSLSEAKNTWFDFRDNVGGGVLDLIRHVRGGSRREALEWVAQTFSLPLDGNKFSDAEKRDYAQRRARAERDARPLARLALVWLDERLIQLDAAKARANEDGDLDALACYAGEHYRLSRVTEDGVLREYLRHRDECPEECAGLVRAGTLWTNACWAAVEAVIRQIAAEQKVCRGVA